MNDNNHNQNENAFEMEKEQEIEKKQELDAEAQYEKHSDDEKEDAIMPEDVADIWEAMFLDPELELTSEAEEELMSLLREDQELLSLQQVYRMGPASGEALAHADALMERMEELADEIREVCPGYKNMSWMDVLADVASVHPQKTMLKTDLEVNEMTVGIWHQKQDGEMFAAAALEDLRSGKPASILTVYVEDHVLGVEYYCPGRFRERPSLVLKKKGDSEGEAFSVTLDADSRMGDEDGKLRYEGFEENIEDGIYEIEFLTDFRG